MEKKSGSNKPKSKKTHTQRIQRFGSNGSEIRLLDVGDAVSQGAQKKKTKQKKN